LLFSAWRHQDTPKRDGLVSQLDVYAVLNNKQLRDDAGIAARLIYNLKVDNHDHKTENEFVKAKLVTLEAKFAAHEAEHAVQSEGEGRAQQAVMECEYPQESVRMMHGLGCDLPSSGVVSTLILSLVH
jgi:hypothetical protein